MKISVVKNASHTLAYSLVALQEMNLAYKYPIIFWNCACLITDSGGAEDYRDEDGIYFDEDNIETEENPEEAKKKTKNSDYNKLATAIGKMIQNGIDIVPPDINNSSYTFTPDVENNRILYGLSGMTGVGEEVIQETIKHRPYASIKDYYIRVKPKKPAMITLIKGGAFDNLMDRKEAMIWYIWQTCDKKNNLTLQNMGSLIKYNMLPANNEKEIMARRVYEFTRYLKSICKLDNNTYKLDERAINFITELGEEDKLVLNGSSIYLNAKVWDKIYQTWMDLFRNWIVNNKATILQNLNYVIFKEDWDKYALGNYSSWEMSALCFYYHEHELQNINREKYGFSNFFNMPEEPVVDKIFDKSDKTITMFKLSKIFGTCIAKNKNKAQVSLLTPDGVVNVKFRKEYFSLFDKQISVKNPDGTKTVKEKSWFNKGGMIVVNGVRSGDNFIAKNYASSGGHTLYRIKEIVNNTDLILTHERYQGDLEEEDNV